VAEQLLRLDVWLDIRTTCPKPSISRTALTNA
jgi:hypothetical protein